MFEQHYYRNIAFRKKEKKNTLTNITQMPAIKKQLQAAFVDGAAQVFARRVSLTEECWLGAIYDGIFFALKKENFFEVSHIRWCWQK